MSRDRFTSGPIWPAKIGGIDLSFGFNCGLASSKDAAAMSARLRWQSIGTNWIAAAFRRHGLGCCPIRLPWFQRRHGFAGIAAAALNLDPLLIFKKSPYLRKKLSGNIF
jgi:hypothetical protein